MADRLLVLFLFSLILGRVNGDSYYPCPAQEDDYAFCSAVILYVIDASTALPASQIVAEFNFTRYHILPRTDWHNPIYVSFYTYGSGPDADYVPTNDLSMACSQLSGLQHEYDQYGSSSASLYDALVKINGAYSSFVNSIVLFTGNKNIGDIQNAATYVKYNMMSIDFTVVALQGSLVGTSIAFPGTIYQINDLNNPPEKLDWCILNRACHIDPKCYYNETTGPTVAPTPAPTTPTTTSTTSSTTTTTTPSTTTTTSGTPSTLQCQCDTMSAWVDMIFVIDASASTGATGLNEMWGMAGTMLELFNVQKTGYTGTQYNSRVGIITYGNSANVLYPLGSLDNDDIDNLFNLPFNNEPRANLEAGIQAAVQQFNGPNHRSNARRVIIVMAAVFNPEGENAPNKTATTFKEQDGVLIVYNYVPAHGLESPILESLASAGYFFSTTLASHYTDIALALCDANCFCRDLLHPYGLSSPRQYPTQGCYIQTSAESNYARAANNCKSNYFNGILTIDENSAKTAFLRALLPNSAFYIGLQYNTINARWEWPDGTVPGSYQPWAGGKVPDGSSLQCAYLNSNSQWQPVDCRNGYPYVCEVMPCDSVHYCG